MFDNEVKFEYLTFNCLVASGCWCSLKKVRAKGKKAAQKAVWDTEIWNLEFWDLEMITWSF